MYLNLKMKDCVFLAILFCYIFSFYVYIPVVFIFFPFLVIYTICNSSSKSVFFMILSNKYILLILLILLLLIFFSIVFPTLHQTFDYSFTYTLINQFIYLLIGVLIASSFYKSFIRKDIIECLIVIFIIQSIIQLIVFSIPTLQDHMFFFNRADDFASDGYKGIRGLALASGTGWNLSLSYGLIFILTFYYALQRENIFKSIVYIFLLFVGCFFAGRTGYLGMLFGFILFFGLSNIIHKAKILFFIPVFSILLFIFIGFFPNIYTSLEEKVFPFVFEFYYNYENSGRFETGSTNVLIDMWKTDFDPNKLIFGYGYFTDPYTGAYFKKVDIGILRNLFFWGGGGYFILICYQTYFFLILYKYMKKIEKNIFFLLVFLMGYLFIAEFKAMTLGYNKMVISILFLIVVSYFMKSSVELNKQVINDVK